MVSKQDVMKALKDCYDPEIPINVVDLGLIYDISINSGRVDIQMTLTAVGCPLSGVITNEVMQKVSTIKGVKNVDVKLVFDPPWSPKRMNSKARQQLGL